MFGCLAGKDGRPKSVIIGLQWEDRKSYIASSQAPQEFQAVGHERFGIQRIVHSGGTMSPDHAVHPNGMIGRNINTGGSGIHGSYGAGAF